MSQKWSVKDRLLAEKTTLLSVYFALLLDNLLLTAVVPILPHFVHHHELNTEHRSNESTPPYQDENAGFQIYTLLKSSAQHIHIGRSYHPDIGENSRLGFLLSLKAIVQLVANPLIAVAIQRKGFILPLLVGTVNIGCCALLFAFGTSYEVLAAARALQGITSACFTIAGLGLVASTYLDENSRSVALGRALGGGAVGVLLGYPIGGFFFQLVGKTAPFLIVFAMAAVLFVAFSLTMYYTDVRESVTDMSASEVHFPAESPIHDDCKVYRGGRKIVLGVAVGAIFLTTSVMSLLEPCLPLWLMETMKPERWQLGAVFLPDSCGYLLTTHFLGGFAYRFGRWKVALISALLLGLSCCLVPLATSIVYLTVPHLGIGIGIGAVDASLVPLLATLADHRSSDSSDSLSYGGTFALGQTAVSLAYCLGPLLGGVLVESIGFPSMMLTMGILNLLYSPLILLLKPKTSNQSTVSERTSLKIFQADGGYTRFKNETN